VGLPGYLRATTGLTDETTSLLDAARRLATTNSAQRRPNLQEPMNRAARVETQDPRNPTSSSNSISTAPARWRSVTALPVLRSRAHRARHPPPHASFDLTVARHGGRRDRSFPRRRGHAIVSAKPQPTAGRRWATRRASVAFGDALYRWTRRGHAAGGTLSAAVCVHTGEKDNMLHFTIAGSEAPYHPSSTARIRDAGMNGDRPALCARSTAADPTTPQPKPIQTVARALRQSRRADPRVSGVPSTKCSCEK